MKLKLKILMSISILLGFIFSCSTTTIHTTVPFSPKKKSKDVSHRSLGNKERCPCKKKKEEGIVLNNNDYEEGVGGSSEDDNFDQVGLASWYGRDFDGKPTASSEIFDSRKLTAAHKKIPLGSIILVRNMANDKEVFLKVNDRGPYIKGRILDVSEYASEVLGYKEDGLTHVGIRIVRKGDKDLAGKERGSTYSFFEKNKDEEDQSYGSDDTSNIEVDNGQDYYSVQVGVFNNARHARKLANRLSHYDQTISILRKDAKFMVRLGNFSEKEMAKEFSLELEEDNFKAFVVAPY